MFGNLDFLVVPLHFTVEFLGFLVAAGGALLILSRPALVPGARSNRMMAALGLIALAVSHVVHGGAFQIENQFDGQYDADQLVLGLRAFGFALILVGVVGASATRAAAAVPVSKALLYAPAAAALLLAVVAFAGSARAATRPLRRLGLAALLLAVAEALTAQAPREVLGAGPPGGFISGAHAAKALGYIALASWLWTGVRLSIRTRFVASFVALLIAVVLALSTSLTGVIARNVESDERARVSNQLTSIRDDIQGDEAKAEVLDRTRTVAAFGDIQASVAAGERQALGETAASFRVNEVLEPFESDFVLFLDAKKHLLASDVVPPRIRPNGRGRDVSTSQTLAILGTPLLRDLATSPESVGLDRIGDAVAMVAVHEISFNGRRVGYLIMGDWIDALTIEGISDSVGAPASLALQDKILATELPGRPRLAQLLPDEARDLVTRQPLVSQTRVGRRSYYTGYIELEAKNERGAILMISSPASLVSATRAGLTRTLFLVAMGVAAIAFVLAWLFGRRITRPIQELTATAGAVREGDLTAKATVSGADEVGQLGETFNQMTASLLRMTSDLREAAREEQQLRARIETIIQNMADGLVAVDADAKILAFNREAESLTGIKAKSAIGKSVDKILDARDVQGEPVALPIHTLTEGAVGNVFLQRRTGDPVPIAFTSVILRNEDDEVAGAVAVMRDLTREREIERIKSEFLSNISHELRTPLTPIKGYAEILERKMDVPPEKMQKFVRGILDSTSRLERIVELLVDFAAMEAGRLAPKSTPVDVGELVERLAQEWEARTPRHMVVAEIRPRLPKVIGDERLLRRSIEEILDNAVKFSPGGGTIKLQARGTTLNGQGSGRAVQVSVTDEGIGISENELPKIFSDFHQVDASETRAYGGLGLGLAFVQRIIEAHHGDVTAKSKQEKGTTLTITIPAATSRRKADGAAV